LAGGDQSSGDDGEQNLRWISVVEDAVGNPGTAKEFAIPIPPWLSNSNILSRPGDIRVEPRKILRDSLYVNILLSHFDDGFKVRFVPEELSSQRDIGSRPRRRSLHAAEAERRGDDRD